MVVPEMIVTLQSVKGDGLPPGIITDPLWAAMQTPCNFYLELSDPTGEDELRRFEVPSLHNLAARRVRLAGWQMDYRGRQTVLVARLHLALGDDVFEQSVEFDMITGKEIWRDLKKIE